MTSEETKASSKYDKEFFILLQDWIKEDSESAYTQIHWRNFKFFRGYANTTDCFWHNRLSDGAFLPPLPFDTILLNGKGWPTLPARVANLDAKVLSLPLDVFTVETNKKYLFRVVSASNGHPFEVSVTGHKLRVVATDGNAITPVDSVDSVIVHSGERYDLELDTKTSDAEADNFFVVVKTLDKLTYNFSSFTGEYFGLGVLHYASVSDTALKRHEVRVCSSADPCHVANCFHKFPRADTKCTSVHDMQALSIPAADADLLHMKKYDSATFEEHMLNFHFSGEQEKRASVNNFQYMKPVVPAYFSAQEAAKSCASRPECVGERLCQCNHVVNVKKGSVVQMTFFSMGVGSYVNNTAHPIHLHGHHFYVMKVGFPRYDPVTGILKDNNADLACATEVNSCNRVTWSNADWSGGNVADMSTRPVKKDTVFIPMGGYVVIRFRADNVGAWFLHCHIENHMVEGMSLVVQEGTNEQLRSLVKWDQIHTCGKGFTQPASSSSAPRTVFVTTATTRSGLLLLLWSLAAASVFRSLF